MKQNKLSFYWCKSENLFIKKNDCLDICWTFDHVYGWVMLADCEDCKFLPENPAASEASGIGTPPKAAEACSANGPARRAN